MRRMAAWTWCAMIAAHASAGVQWIQTVTSSDTQANVETVVMTCYAQDGNLRQEFTRVERRTRTDRMEKGFWLFRADADTIAMVDDTEKSYVEMSLDAMMNMTGGMSSLMNMKINNPSVTVEKLAPEKFGGYECSRYRVRTTYDMEMKMMMVSVRQRVEQVTEYWLTAAFPMKEINRAFINKQYRTGMKDLDALIQKNIEAYREMGSGFPVKTVMTGTTTDLSKKNAKPQNTYTETVISGVKTRPLPQTLFRIPAGYTKVEMHGMGSEAPETQDPAGTKTARPAKAPARNDTRSAASKQPTDTGNSGGEKADEDDVATQEALKKGLQNLFFK
jgi:hypothetical protein